MSGSTEPQTQEPTTEPATDGTPVPAGEPEPTLATQPEPTQPPAPEPFELDKLELPEGFTLNDEHGAALREMAEKYGIGQAAMQDMTKFGADLVAKATETAEQGLVNTWKETTEGWKKEVVEKYGSETAAVEAAAKFAPIIDQYGGPGFREMLDATGMGNNPVLFDFLSKVSEVLSEGTPVGARAEPAPVNPMAQLYPNSPELHKG